ncbi:MAG TPA: hypothetical protein VIE36_09270 [Methylomirabilota bacterium]|jgi:hypothetical protein
MTVMVSSEVYEECPMDHMERVLRADLERLIDRLSISVPEGAVAPALGARVDTAEERLAAAYAALVDDYGRWRIALDDMENVWALAVWRSAFADVPAEAAVPRAA